MRARMRVQASRGSRGRVRSRARAKGRAVDTTGGSGCVFLVVQVVSKELDYGAGVWDSHFTAQHSSSKRRECMGTLPKTGH